MIAEKPPAAGPLRCDPAPVDSPNGAAGASDGGGVEKPGGLQVRYCGGCNPFIDRVGVADAVRAGLEEDTLKGAGATLYVSGCQRSCAAQHRLTDEEDAQAVVVAGETVDAAPTAAAQIPAAVLDKIRPPAATSPSGPPARQKQRDIADEG
jgi:hypothetical protein